MWENFLCENGQSLLEKNFLFLDNRGNNIHRLFVKSSKICAAY